MAPYVALIIVVGIVFGVCRLVDIGFTRTFRGMVQHASGKAVRLNKKYGSIGLVMAVLGVAGIFTGVGDLNWLLVVGGGVLVAVGVGLVGYYMTFGVYDDEDSFIHSAFGKKSVTYRFSQIKAQQLYTSAAGVIIELHMDDGRAIQLQPGMTGVDDFMNHAFSAWLQQTGRTVESCQFYDPDNSCWFPPVE